MAGRICAVCDVYDALLSKRPYKDPWTVEEALAEIERGSGTHFDPRLTAIFVELAPQLTGALEAPSVPVRSPNVVEPLTA
jgi:putative two-component system response regulator